MRTSMDIYIKYFVIWVLFMGIIASIAVVVPKLSAFIERKFARGKEENDAETERESKQGTGTK